MFWTLGEISIVILGLWLVARILFRRPAAGPPTRSSHLAAGVICALVAVIWAGLCLLICFNAAFAGHQERFIVAVFLVGGVVWVGLVAGAVKSFRAAQRRGTGELPTNDQ